MKRSLLAVLLACASLAVTGQETGVAVKGAHPYKTEENETVATEYAHWSIIPHIGFNVFDGDFNSEKQHSVSIPNAGIALEYAFTPVWSLGIDYMFDRYGVPARQGQGTDNADVLLKGYMHQLGAYMSMDVLPLFFPHAKRKIVNIQPFVGAGHSWYRNQVMYDDDSRGHTGSYIWSDGATGPKSMDAYKGAFFVRGGLNVEFNLNRTLALGIRAQYNYFMHDYVDNRGFSGINAVASKNNDGIADITLNMRFKLEAVKKTHERNITHEFAAKDEGPRYVHDTVIIRHDSVIVREKYKQVVTTKTPQRVYYVYFPTNKSVLDEKALITIQQVADVMAEDTALYAVVTGYCDNTGSDKLNYALGDKRAGNVMGELRDEHAIHADHLYSTGMGKLIGHRSQAAYGPNRRVAIRLVDKAAFERMKSELSDKRAQRVTKEGKAAGPEAGELQEEEKTIPLSQSARKEKVNVYKQRAGATVTVDKATTMAGLARKYYDNTYCWVYIYIANKEKINNPNALIPGTELVIPELTEKEMKITKDESLLIYTNTHSSR